MRISFGLLVAALSAVGAFAPSAAAGAAAGLFRDAAPRPERLQLSSPVLAPMAFSRFCLRYREECEIHRLPDASGVTQARWGEVSRVNAEVNRAIAPQADDGDVVHETWLVAPAAGACHDYAVTKRHELMQLGWPSRALLLAEVVTGWGEHHLVLLVRTRAGDFVADNLYPGVRPWYAAPYRWVKLQTPENPMYWSTVEVEPTTTAEPSLASAPGQDQDDTLVAADATELAVAAEQRDATDAIWTLEAPTVRYALDDGLELGSFSLAGPAAIASATPVAVTAPPAAEPQFAPADERRDANFVRGGPVDAAAAASERAAVAVVGRSDGGLAADPFGYGSLISMN
jgi:predicted transglutaminase-like cysteine proteinase